MKSRASKQGDILRKLLLPKQFIHGRYSRDAKVKGQPGSNRLECGNVRHQDVCVNSLVCVR